MDPIAVASLVVGVIGTGAAIVAAYYSKKAPSREDLKRVEFNTAQSATAIEAVKAHISKVEDHLSEQNKRETLIQFGCASIHFCECMEPHGRSSGVGFHAD
jgi:hypothetical protein